MKDEGIFGIVIGYRLKMTVLLSVIDWRWGHFCEEDDGIAVEDLDDGIAVEDLDDGCDMIKGGIFGKAEFGKLC